MAGSRVNFPGSRVDRNMGFDDSGMTESLSRSVTAAKWNVWSSMMASSGMK